MLTFRIHIPQWKRCFGALAFWVLRHAQLIQHSNAANALRQSVRRCQALVATLQRHLRIHRPRIPFFLCGSSVLQDMVPEQLVLRAREQRPHRSIQLDTSVQSGSKLLLLRDFFRQHRLLHLRSGERGCFILQGSSAQHQGISHGFQQAVQHCFVLLFEKVDDMTLLRVGNSVLFPMAMLESPFLRFHAFQRSNSISAKRGHCRGSEGVFTFTLVEALLHMMSTIERLVEAHEINVHDVVHQEEELRLCTRRLRNHFMHAL